MISFVVAVLIGFVLFFSLYNLMLLREMLISETTKALHSEAEDMLLATAESQAESIEQYLDKYVTQLLFAR